MLPNIAAPRGLTAQIEWVIPVEMAAPSAQFATGFRRISEAISSQ